MPHPTFQPTYYQDKNLIPLEERGIHENVREAERISSNYGENNTSVLNIISDLYPICPQNCHLRGWYNSPHSETWHLKPTGKESAASNPAAHYDTLPSEPQYRCYFLGQSKLCASHFSRSVLWLQPLKRQQCSEYRILSIANRFYHRISVSKDRNPGPGDRSFSGRTTACLQLFES